MLTQPTKPLEIAARILTAPTLARVSRAPFNRIGWAILDRWALGFPDELKKLEAMGTVALYGRLLTQQQLEESVLAEGLEPGLTEAEVLQRSGVDLTLKP